MKYTLKHNEAAYIKLECPLGINHVESKSPTSKFYVVYTDKLHNRALFHACLEGKKTPIIATTVIYKELADKERPRLIEIFWSEDGLKAALVIDHVFQTVFDFEELRAYSKSKDVDTGNYGFKNRSKWSDNAIKFFLANPDELIVPEDPPTPKEKREAFATNYLKPLLKKWGYQKDGQTWKKDKGDFYVVIFLRNSSYNYIDGDVSFWFDFGAIQKKNLKDPAKKKVMWEEAADLRDYPFALVSKEGRIHRYKDNRYITIKEDTDMQDFTHEMSLDFENEILPFFETIADFNDWKAFMKQRLERLGFPHLANFWD